MFLWKKLTLKIEQELEQIDKKIYFRFLKKGLNGVIAFKAIGHKFAHFTANC